MSERDRPILVVGAAGQVGGALCDRLGGERVLATVRGEAPAGALHLDLEEPDGAARVVREARPRAVVLAAGFTWVDGCERDPPRAYRVNRDGPRAVARAARAVGARTVYFSTEYVFDGENGPYSEEDPVRPISVYGQSKLEGEAAVLEEDPGALIVRTTVVYGPERQGKNFVYQVARRLAAGEPVQAPHDQISSPTYNRDLADATVRLLETGARGVFHVTGAWVADRAAFGRRVARALGYAPETVRGVDTSSLGQLARRPLRAGLRIDKLRQALPGFAPLDVEAAIDDWRQRPSGQELGE